VSLAGSDFPALTKGFLGLKWLAITISVANPSQVWYNIAGFRRRDAAVAGWFSSESRDRLI
jgi:hypothetical protein